MLRRQLVVSSGLLTVTWRVFASDDAAPLASARMMGTWKSDAVLSTRLWNSPHGPLTAEQREGIARMFGQMVWTITSSTFSYQAPPMPQAVTARYVVTGATSSSVSMRFLRPGTDGSPDTLTIYVGTDHIFARGVHGNFEFFRRVAG